MAQEFDSDVEDAPYEKNRSSYLYDGYYSALGNPINLDKLFEMTRTHLISIWLPIEGILKFEHKKW